MWVDVGRWVAGWEDEWVGWWVFVCVCTVHVRACLHEVGSKPPYAILVCDIVSRYYEYNVIVCHCVLIVMDFTDPCIVGCQFGLDTLNH